MDTFQKIFVAVHDSKISNKGFQYTCLLAHNSRTPLQIVHVVEEFGNVGYPISKELEKTGQEILQKYKARAKFLGLASVKTINARGNASEEILKIANRENLDTIIIGRRPVFF